MYSIYQIKCLSTYQIHVWVQKLLRVLKGITKKKRKTNWEGQFEGECVDCKDEFQFQLRVETKDVTSDMKGQ